MVRECSPRERALSSLKLARRSTMTTSVRGSALPPASFPSGRFRRSPPQFGIHPSSFPSARQETLHHTPGLAASPALRCYIDVDGIAYAKVFPHLLRPRDAVRCISHAMR